MKNVWRGLQDDDYVAEDDPFVCNVSGYIN